MGITGALLIYRLLQYLSFPFILLYFTARLVLRREYRPFFRERLGFLPRMFTRTEPGCIWLHAVSVGEIASATPLLRELRADYPRIPLYVSTSTVAGRRIAEKQLATLTDGIFYAPIDYASCVRRVIRTIRPALLIVLETEIWPNLYAEVKACGAALTVINARISDRTWRTYRRTRAFFCPVLRLADLIAAQSQVDYTRYRSLGVDPSKLLMAGNLKYDAAIAPAKLSIAAQTSSIWIAASTVEEQGIDEDDVVIPTFRALANEFPGLLLILAPRQPARFDIVAAKLAHAGISFTRRTTGTYPPLPGVLLLDTIGELAGLYHHANVVFVGGSIAPRGGHNILEPAAAGVPVIVGPHTANFQSIIADFLNSAALTQITSAAELTTAVHAFLRDPELAQSAGTKARAVVEQNRGVSTRLSGRLMQFYRPGFTTPPRGLFSRTLLRSLAWLWRTGGKAKRQRGLAVAGKRTALPVPVVSIGGITVGGSGKTPFCDYLARELRNRGYTPAIVTRGYRRRSPAKCVILPAGAHVPAALTGDEAQIFLHSAKAIVGIGADRYAAAQSVLHCHPAVDIFLMDDGFQHATMQRDLDIVLIDGLDPFGGGDVVPLGRLREPLASLSRAGLFVITRAHDGQRRSSIGTQLRQHNPTAPIFAAGLSAREWRSYPAGQPVPGLRGRVAAFCGLGNPQSFWNTLNTLGLEVVFRWSFADHHQYKPTDIQRLAHQARTHGVMTLVTTEKDSINLPPETQRMLNGVELLWLRVESTLPDPDSFFSHLEKLLVPGPRQP